MTPAEVRPTGVQPPGQARRPWGSAAGGTLIGLLLAAVLLPLGLANMVLRAGWHEVEDGVLWVARTEGVVAAEVAPRSPAAAADVRAGDVLLAIDGRPIDRPADVFDLLHGGRDGQPLRYTLLRLQSQSVTDVRLAPVPQGNRTLYYVLAAVGLFTLLIGVLVRLRRPSEPATLHFLWLTLAFFGVFGFSFSGSLDLLDWVFLWVDTLALLLLAPLFLHFTLFFPDRPRAWVQGRMGSFVAPLIYLPALLMAAARIVAVARAGQDASFYISGVVGMLERIEPLYLSLCLLAGLAVLVRAFGQVQSGTARRQLRWIVWGTLLGGAPFAAGLCAAVRAGGGADARHAADGDPARADPAGVRERPGPLPPDGRRGDRQADAGLRGGRVGDPRHLRGAAARGGGGLSGGLPQDTTR